MMQVGKVFSVGKKTILSGLVRLAPCHVGLSCKQENTKTFSFGQTSFTDFTDLLYIHLLPIHPLHLSFELVPRATEYPDADRLQSLWNSIALAKHVKMASDSEDYVEQEPVVGVAKKRVRTTKAPAKKV